MNITESLKLPDLTKGSENPKPSLETGVTRGPADNDAKRFRALLGQEPEPPNQHKTAVAGRTSERRPVLPPREVDVPVQIAQAVATPPAAAGDLAFSQILPDEREPGGDTTDSIATPNDSASGPAAAGPALDLGSSDSEVLTATEAASPVQQPGPRSSVHAPPLPATPVPDYASSAASGVSAIVSKLGAVHTGPAASGGSPSTVERGATPQANAPDAASPVARRQTGSHGESPSRDMGKDSDDTGVSRDSGSGARSGGTADHGDRAPDRAASPAALPETTSPAAVGPTPTAGGPDTGSTPVNSMSLTVNAPTPDGGPTPAASFRSAQNLLVMRNAAQGELDHPELGRVAVSAQLRGGEVDVRVTASRPETALFLAPRADAMTADARAANVPVARVEIGDPGGSGASLPGDLRGGSRGDANDPRHPESGAAATPVAPRAPKRVRIVL